MPNPHLRLIPQTTQRPTPSLTRDLAARIRRHIDQLQVIALSEPRHLHAILRATEACAKKILGAQERGA
jgi:hypothetical protein